VAESCYLSVYIKKLLKRETLRATILKITNYHIIYLYPLLKPMIDKEWSSPTPLENRLFE